MLISITNTAEPATDLGFLLHKNPASLHSADLALGKAYVFYSSATPQRCTACLLLELDPVALVRGAQRPEDYVNDRPYLASSYLTVAMGRIFGTALVDRPTDSLSGNPSFCVGIGPADRASVFGIRADVSH